MSVESSYTETRLMMTRRFSVVRKLVEKDRWLPCPVSDKIILTSLKRHI